LDTAKKLYEGMFLVDSAQAASDWAGTVAAIEKIFERAEAEVVSLKKWDERKLTYDINRKSRGTYILAYFSVDTSKITGIERDVQLSESITRVLILTTDKMSKEDIERNTPIEAIAAQEVAAAKAAEEKAAAREAEAAEKAAAEAAEAEAAPEATSEAEVTEAEVTEAAPEAATEEE
jgi:small subunit ribosomal protein S6